MPLWHMVPLLINTLLPIVLTQISLKNNLPITLIPQMILQLRYFTLPTAPLCLITTIYLNFLTQIVRQQILLDVVGPSYFLLT